MRSERWAALTAYSASQHGLVSTGQALDCGVSAAALQRAIDHRLLTPVRRGVLRLTGAPLSPWQDLMAACLASGGHAVASHRSAGVLHGLAVATPERPEVVCGDEVPDHLIGVRCHRTRALDDDDVTTVAQVPCTTIARTIIDLAGQIPASRLAGFVDDADRRRLCRPVDIEGRLDAIGSRGRHGAAKLRAVLALRVSGSTPLETAWLRHLSEAGIPRPVLQHQVIVGRRVVLLDAAWPDRLVGLEVDGWDPHRTRTAFDRDAARSNQLLLAGWRVVHATSRSIPDVVIGQLRRLLVA